MAASLEQTPASCKLASGRHVDITGIDNHKIKNARIGSCGGVVNTQRGEVIVVLHEYAILGKGQTMI